MTDQVLVLISEYLPTDIPVSYLTLLLLPLAYLRESAPNDKVIKSIFAPREQHLIPSFLSGVSISVIVVIWVYSSLASCFLLFGAYNWMSVVSVSIVDGNISQFFFSECLLMPCPVLVLIRTWALWRKSKVVLIALSFLVVV